MTRLCLFGLFVLLAFSSSEVSARPSNESDSSNEVPKENPLEKERSLSYDESNTENQESTKEILEKIKAINNALRKPSRRPPLYWNQPQQTSEQYVLDKDILQQLQNVIASGKLHSYGNNVKQQASNTINNENQDNIRYSRQISSLYSGNPATTELLSSPYITNIPVLVVPTPTRNVDGYSNTMDLLANYQARAGPFPGLSGIPGLSGLGQFPGLSGLGQIPSIPGLSGLGQIPGLSGLGQFPGLSGLSGLGQFSGLSNLGQFQWPFASLFPILVRDPLLSAVNGGGWNNFIEVGQSADVCNRKQKSDNKSNELLSDIQNKIEYLDNLISTKNSLKTRQKRAIKKRTVTQESETQDIQKNKNIKSLFSTKPTTKKPIRKDALTEDTLHYEKTPGDLRLPFFNLFNQKDPVPPGTGIVINRLKVRKGGVAIAGPGGVATAGRGGTAIVGPGGLAYTKPGGLAVADSSGNKSGSPVTNGTGTEADQTNTDSME